MKNHIITTLGIAIAVAVIVACGGASENQSASNSPKDTTAGRSITAAESGYADINGLKMYYEVYGEGKPLVLLHGSYMNIPMNWAHIIPTFAKDRKVIVAEMQGHGRTKDTDREFTYENMADDVSGLLDHLKIDSTDILGYSMGAGITFQVAVRHPEKVRRLIILSGTYAHNGWWPEAEAAFATITAEAFMGSPIQKQYDSLGNDPAKFPDFVKKVIGPDLKPYDWSKDVKKIQAPMLMIIGDADGVRYEHALELFRVKGGGKMGDMNGLPKSRLAILPGTTHIGMIVQRTGMWVPIVSEFLDSDLSPAPPMF